MFIMLIYSLIAVVISSLFPLLAFILAKNYLYDREKTTPFECGFDPNKKARTPFSLRFFLVTILFLIFDVEIALLLPLVLLMNYAKPLTILGLSFSMTMILVLGLIHEWNQGALAWVS
uniref:NADH-ubiquinone oxidoreductase chain 3 n=1 Tax=Pandorites podoceroides TaxID=1842081 RepID=A0A9N6YK19_9CRUS|nr:TPA_asm: ND3 [Pandorites podoceroides]